MTRAWVDIDLGALRRNGRAFAARAGVPLLCMVKADAYGVGAVAAAQALSAIEPWGFGVATVDEGSALRDVGIGRPIVIFTPLLRDDLERARDFHLTPALGGAREISDWTSLGGGPWQLQVDTGMSRAGARWDELATLRDLIASSPPEGAFTHFHSAEHDSESVAVQERRFGEAVAALRARPRLLHAENSAAIVRRGHARWDLARPGVFLYGVGFAGQPALVPEPVAQVRARIVEIRALRDGETVSYDARYTARGARRIATTAIGYGDGYPRAMSGCGTALVHGRAVPVVGVVTMDMTMLDVTEVPCAVGDVATFLGRDGDAELTPQAVAAAGGLSPYEVLTRLHGRLARVVHGGDA